MNWIEHDILTGTDGHSRVAGPLASFNIGTVSPSAWDRVQLSASYKTMGRSLYVNIDPWYVAIDEQEGCVSVSRYVGGNLFAAWDIDLPQNAWLTAEIVVTVTSITINVHGQVLSYNSADSILLTSAAVYFAEGTELLPPAIEVNEIVQPDALAPEPGRPKSLDFTVDFYDDLLLAPFDQEMLDEMFRTMAHYKAGRAYWIHHGRRDAGLWKGGPGEANMAKSFDQLGEDFLPAAVTAAHKAGLPLIGIFKPFETGVMHNTSPIGDAENRVAALGGVVDRSWKFAAAHPELWQARRSVPGPQNPARQIIIRSRKDISSFGAGDIQLYESGDNATFSPYHGPVEVVIDGHELRLSNLQIDQPFLALSFTPALARQIENTLPLLAEVRDESGSKLEFTYGLAQRIATSAEYHLSGQRKELDFRTHGINFDCAGHGVPSAVWNARKPLLDLYSPAGMLNVLGIALAVNESAPGVLSEAEPGTQNWWLQQIEEMLEAGVDGVDIRIMNHGNIIDWNLYGFNPPLVAEYQRRYGVDICREEFCRAKFRALRGEFFTAFLRRASQLVRSRGKEFHLHIEDTHQGPADEPCPMEIAMPWRQWIEERLCDGVTLKVLNTFANDSAFGREVLALCRAQGIPVSFSSFIHSTFCEPNPQEILESQLASPYHAFNIYEFATLFEFTPAGEVKVVNESITNWLKGYPWLQKTPV